jgi:heme-degrading monooxygenase HmoA
MILEIADFKVVADRADEFPAAVEQGLQYVSDTPGFHNARLTRSIESPNRFVLIIEWDDVEAHTVGFRESENFGKWRGVVGPFFDGAPFVEHVDVVVSRS